MVQRTDRRPSDGADNVMQHAIITARMKWCVPQFRRSSFEKQRLVYNLSRERFQLNWKRVSIRPSISPSYIILRCYSEVYPLKGRRCLIYGLSGGWVLNFLLNTMPDFFTSPFVRSSIRPSACLIRAEHKLSFEPVRKTHAIAWRTLLFLQHFRQCFGLHGSRIIRLLAHGLKRSPVFRVQSLLRAYCWLWFHWSCNRHCCSHAINSICRWGCDIGCGGATLEYSRWWIF